MVGNPVLRIIISPNLLATFTSSDLEFSLFVASAIFLLLIEGLDLGPNHLHTNFFILKLSFFGLAAHHNSGWNMSDTNSRFRLVDVLATGPLATISINF